MMPGTHPVRTATDTERAAYPLRYRLDWLSYATPRGFRVVAIIDEDGCAPGFSTSRSMFAL